MDGWENFDQHQRGAYRTRNTVAGVILMRGDDSGPLQLHQTIGHVGELRSSVPRVQQPGLSSMPLPGAKGVAIYHGGYRGGGAIVAVEDPRYRPTGLNPGEAQLYGVDGADAKGAGGTMWSAFQALLGKVAKVLGTTILIGNSNTSTITLAGSGSLTINLTGQTVNITGATKVTVLAPRTEVSNGGSVQAVKLADGSNSTTLFAQ